MTSPAGKVEKGFLWKQEYLSPLPIPTGQPASDILSLIWRKNDTYLDIGSLSLAGSWAIAHVGTVIFLSVMIYPLIYGDYVLAFMMFMGGLLLMGFCWSLFIGLYRRPLAPPLRFHRQRREVRITTPDGEEWTVPWERVHAIAPSATMIGQFGAAQMGGLILWFPYAHEIDQPYHKNKEGWVMMVSPGPGVAAMRQWECIRSFMEVGPEAVPEPLQDLRGKSLKDIFLDGFNEVREKHGFFVAVLWDIGVWCVLFNIMTYHLLHRRKFAVIPDLESPEGIAWSQPLPPEQWAQRSPELEAAMAERKQDLAALKAESPSQAA
ncbi:hypothetical protein [Halopseudomonas pelagia]|uniref:hypothetical protein n=1 Tax=Halopseudomonas pelagia TaxID=553151 RepID=UPI0030DA672F|tara:strand:+ start:65 stop:1027 length:963 start_codon:yes stop_codon:yes gene_type:complete